MTTIARLEELAKKITTEQQEELRRKHLDCDANTNNAIARVARVVMGKKYAKIDVGSSGKYMVEIETGRIYGIKSYGVIHRGHQYGTLDTINDYFWGSYTARKLTR